MSKRKHNQMIGQEEGMVERVQKQVLSHDEFKNVPPDELRKIVIMILQETSQTSITYASHFPPPALLEGYKSLSPEILERIMVMAEATHKAKIAAHEKEIAFPFEELKSGHRFRMVGLLAALFTLVTSFGFIGFLVYINRAEVAAFAALFGAIAYLIGKFLNKKR